MVLFSLHGARVSPGSGDSVGVGLVLGRQEMGALDAWLRERDYSQRSRDGIAVHVRANGELAGCVPEYLDREDLETATEVFCEALPPVPQTSRDWDVEGYQTPSDARPLLATAELGPDDILPDADDLPTDPAFDAPEPERDPLAPQPALLGPDDGGPDLDSLPDVTPDRDRKAPRKLSRVSAWEQDQVERSLPSISGGAPGTEPFEPSPADLAEFASWSADLDDAMAIPKTVPGPRWPNRDNVESYERIARIASTGNID